MERIWVEINSRVNYPVKLCLVKMEESGELNMDLQSHKFCVSWFAIRVCSVGTKLAVDSWNEHPVPGISYVTGSGKKTHLAQVINLYSIAQSERAHFVLSSALYSIKKLIFLTEVIQHFSESELCTKSSEVTSFSCLF